MTPVIGIATYDDEAAWRNWSARAALLPYSYIDAVRGSGGRPVMLPPGGWRAGSRVNRFVPKGCTKNSTCPVNALTRHDAF